MYVSKEPGKQVGLSLLCEVVPHDRGRIIKLIRLFLVKDQTLTCQQLRQPAPPILLS
jgi:hypothetical protein